MAEATAKTKSPRSAQAQSFAAEAKFPMGDAAFGIPGVEVPAVFRDLAERSLAQAKENYERTKAAAEDATDVLEDIYSTAAKGTSDYALKVIEASRTNTNATFDFARDLFAVKSWSEAVELSTAHARKQFETMTAQGKELSALAQKCALETAEPISAGVSKTFSKVA
jgi:phasin